MDLNTPITGASRSYKMYARRLAKLGIFKLYDFLFHIPFRYEDYSLISQINQIQAGELVTIKGRVEKIENSYTRRWKSLQKAKISDNTGTIDIIWFNQPYIPKALKAKDEVSLSGKVQQEKNGFIMISPDYEVILNNQTIHTGRLVPIYPETKGVSSKWIRRQVFKILEELKNFDDYIPAELIKNNNLIDLSSAIKAIHFPKNQNEAKKARERLSFDEMLKLHLSSLNRKREWQKEKIKPWNVGLFNKKIADFIKSLPFELTVAQKRAVDEVLNDLNSDKPMNRLLEGDVGSGKTVVAAIAAYVAYLNGFQTAFMAPTEILARQHFKTLASLF